MKKILFCGYREWALKIFESFFKEQYLWRWRVIKDQDEFFAYNDEMDEIDLIFFVGWSWIIDKSIVDTGKCICLHPSPLPKYRGGSPLQHQIINGEKTSAVTYFIMNEKVDQGDILFQKEFGLDGDLDDIYDRIIEHGIEGMNEIIMNYMKKCVIKGTPQDHSKKTYFPRRTPDQSEITLQDMENAEKVYNKVRALQDPYPNAFITCMDGTKIYITKSHLGKDTE